MPKKHFLELKIPPVAVFFIFAYLMWVSAHEVPYFDFDLPIKRPIALGVSALSGILAVASIASFIRAKTTVDPMNPVKAKSLVTSGVNRISRNPMYLSLLFVLLAWAIYLSNVAAFALIPFFVLYLTCFQIIPEERTLTSLFGSAYEEYCRRVRRWV